MALSPSKEAAVANSLARNMSNLLGSLRSIFGNSEKFLKIDFWPTHIIAAGGMFSLVLVLDVSTFLTVLPSRSNKLL